MADARRWFRVVVLAGVVGCSGNPLDSVLPPKGSCALASAHSCTDYTGSGFSVPGVGSRTCSAVGNGAVYATTACPTSSRAGSCIVNHGNADEIVIRLYAPNTTAIAQGICGMYSGATFVAN